MNLFPHSFRPSAVDARYGRWIGLAGILTLGLVGSAYGLSTSPGLLHAEGGPIESLQIVLWAMSAVLACLLIFLPSSGSRDRWYALGLGWVASLAVLREMDAHIYFNPDFLGAAGMRYRPDWWFSRNTDPTIRSFWATVIFVALVPGIAAAVGSKPRILTMLKGGDLSTWLIVATVVFLALGFAADDLLRGSMLISKELRQAAEETFELMAALLFLGVVVTVRASPMTAREDSLRTSRPASLAPASAEVG